MVRLVTVLLVATFMTVDSGAQLAGGVSPSNDPATTDAEPTQSGAVGSASETSPEDEASMVEEAADAIGLEVVEGASGDERGDRSNESAGQTSDPAPGADASGGGSSATAADGGEAAEAEAGATTAPGANQTAAQQSAVPTDEVVLFMRRDADREAFLLDALRSEIEDAQRTDASKKSPAVQYSITDNVSASVSYQHAFLFETASDEELRRSRVSAFSTARERDVFGLGMDWGVSEKSRVGVGYQLQSIRPDGTNGEPGGVTSILPGSEAVDHTFSLGVSRSWGGSDGE